MVHCSQNFSLQHSTLVLFLLRKSWYLFIFMHLVQMEMLCSKSCYFKISGRATLDIRLNLQSSQDMPLSALQEFCLFSAPDRYCIHQPLQRKTRLQSTVAKEDLVPLCKQETKRFTGSILPSWQTVGPALSEADPSQS